MFAMKKIVQINVVANWGSTGRIAEEIGQSILRNGGVSYIAYGRKSPKSSSCLLKIGTNLSVKIHVLKTRLFDTHGLCSQEATRNLVRQLDKIKPDIIHLHNIHGYYLNYKILFDYFGRVNIPVVWTLHDCWSYTGHCTHYSYLKCEKWRTVCHHCPNLKAYPKSCFADRSEKNYWQKKYAFTSVRNMTLVPVSNWLAQNVNESFLNHYPTRVIHNGVDINAFSPSLSMKSEHGLAHRFVILGVASVWDQKKGLNDFINLAMKLNADEVIVLVGLSSNQLLKLPSNIVGIRRTENLKQLADLYSLADVFLNPTWEDNFPTTNLEALACGTPIITYRTGGSMEAIDDCTGFVVEQGEIDSVIDNIAIIKEKGKSFYSKACRDRAVNLFNKEDRYTEYVDLYKEILK